MIVGVRNSASEGDITYYNLNEEFGGDRDKARQIAYRFNRKKNEPNYNALVHQTVIIEPKEIPVEVARFLASGLH
ncbi:MAG: hypothetical protein FJ267_15450 [Planctomycetes bacterium]|nr:hypothetical protein [Planctomycetota bacterium]